MATTTAPPGASEQLHATCIKALKEEHNIQLQLEALHLRIKQLRIHGRDLNLKAGTGHTDTENAMLAYAKDTCLKLCSKVHETFPREIRDIIYGYVTDCDNLTVSALPPRLISRKNSRCSYFSSDNEAQARYQDSTHEPEHWWLPAFVGPEMLQELGENYYRMTAFRFKSSFHNISRFRVTDQWKLGFLPVTFVSNIELGLTCEGDEFRVRKDMWREELNPWFGVGTWGGSDRSDPEPEDESTTVSKSELLVQLEALFGFRKGTAITINVYMDDYKDYAEYEKLSFMSEHTVPALLPTLIRLQDADYKVRFVLGVRRRAPWFSHLSRKFVSPWNPVSTEALSKSFAKFIAMEKAADRGEELRDWEDDDFNEDD